MKKKDFTSPLREHQLDAKRLVINGSSMLFGVMFLCLPWRVPTALAVWATFWMLFSGIPPKPYLAKTENIAPQTSHCNCNVAEGPVQSEGVLFGQSSFSMREKENITIDAETDTRNSGGRARILDLKFEIAWRQTPLEYWLMLNLRVNSRGIARMW